MLLNDLLIKNTIILIHFLQAESKAFEVFNANKAHTLNENVQNVNRLQCKTVAHHTQQRLKTFALNFHIIKLLIDLASLKVVLKVNVVCVCIGVKHYTFCWYMYVLSM